MLTIIFYHAFLFFYITDLYFLILVVITQIFDPIAELMIPIGIPAKEEKEEMEIHPVTIDIKISKCLIYFNLYKHFYAFCKLIRFDLFFQLKISY